MNEIELLKRDLRRQYLHMQRVAPNYDCGSALAKEINSDYSIACENVNSTLDALARIDPNTPKTRF